MRHPVDELRAACERVCLRNGASTSEAALLADILVEAELRGRSTHGLNRLTSIIKVLGTHGSARPAIEEERGPVVRINGNDASGYLTAAYATDAAVRVAAREGHALVAAHHTRHAGMMGYYAARAARQGIVALIFTHCAPLMAPTGGTEAVLGTNPIAAGFPFDPFPILIDTSTTAITFGDVDLARRAAKPLPPNAALDAEGRPTTDPAAVKAILPLGGHKGFALGLMVQMLAGVVAGAAPVPKNYGNYGLLIVAMRPDLFAPRDEYEHGVRELVARVKSARRADPEIEVLVPGERSFRAREQRLRDGIEVSDALWAELSALLSS